MLGVFVVLHTHTHTKLLFFKPEKDPCCNCFPLERLAHFVSLSLARSLPPQPKARFSKISTFFSF